VGGGRQTLSPPEPPPRQSPGRLPWRRRLLRAAFAVALLWLCFLVFVPVVRLDAPRGTAILDRRGRLLGAVTASDGQWRFGESPRLPGKYRRALLEYEDRRFFLHPGVDPPALFRAALADLRAGRIVSGGSTLTMQLVRLSRGPRRRSFGEKFIECVLALRLEASTSKEEILRLYAGHAPFGGNTVGVRAAAWRLFGRPLDELSWAEAATLAVLPNAPSLIRPGKNASLLLKKRNALLERLERRGFIDPVSLRSILAEALPGSPRAMPRLAPHLLDRIRKEEPGGGVFRTSLDLDIQRRVLQIAARHHRRLENNGIGSLALLVADTRSGEVRAYVGNAADPGSEGAQVDIIMAPRSSGSILKPFLFAAMLEDAEILPDELVPDIPTRIAGFSPRNFDHRFSGAVPASLALSRSLNVPAVRMLRSHGIARFAALLEKLGVRTLFRPAEDYGLSLILGGAEVRLWEMCGLYAGMGRALLPEHREKAEDFAPLSLVEGGRKSGITSPFSAGVLWTTLKALEELSRPGDESRWRNFSSSRRIAWKTGTSYGFRDAWAIGVTPDFTVGVWAGNADGEGRPGLVGHSAAAPLLFDVFNALPGSAFFEKPEMDLRTVEICAESGFLAGRDCARRRQAEIPLSSLPGKTCPYCRLVHLDGSGRYRVDAGCASLSQMQTKSFFILPPALAGEYRKRHPAYRPLPPWRPGCREDERDRLSCVYPEEGAEIYIPLELDGRRGRMVAEAADGMPGAVVYWHLDRRYLGSTRGEHRLAIFPAPGKHVLTLVDDSGARVIRRFTVLAKSSVGSGRSETGE